MHGCDLEGQRQAVELATQRDDVGGACAVDPEVLAGGGRSCHEQLPCRRRHHLVGIGAFCGEAQRLEAVHPLETYSERFPTRGEDAHLRSRGEDRHRKPCAGRAHMLAAVEQEEARVGREMVAEVGQRLSGPLVRRAHRVRDGHGHELWFGQHRQIHGPHAVGPTGRLLEPELQGQSALSHAAGPGDRDEAVPLDHVGHHREVSSSADERVQGPDEVVAIGGEGTDRWELGSPRDIHLEEPDRVVEVPEAVAAGIVERDDHVCGDPADRVRGHQHLATVARRARRAPPGAPPWPRSRLRAGRPGHCARPCALGPEPRGARAPARAPLGLRRRRARPRRRRRRRRRTSHPRCRPRSHHARPSRPAGATGAARGGSHTCHRGGAAGGSSPRCR